MRRENTFLMIFTVTTATITTVTNFALIRPISLIGILILLALLVQKELASSSSSPFMERLTRILNIGILPMLIAFALIVFVKVAELLNWMK